MEKVIKLVWLLVIGVTLSSFIFNKSEDTISLTVSTSDLKNSNGVVQFTLYNTEGSIPDEHFEKYYLQLKVDVKNNAATTIFKGIPKGTYAINILHDENDNGEIDKGWILPIEGLGFSNFNSLNPLNKPSFKKAKFQLTSDKTINVKIIYM